MDMDFHIYFTDLNLKSDFSKQQLYFWCFKSKFQIHISISLQCSSPKIFFPLPRNALTIQLSTNGGKRGPRGKITRTDRRSWAHYMPVHIKSDRNEQNNKRRHTVKLCHTKRLCGFTLHRTVNCLKETEKGMSGLNFSSWHKELITSNFKAGLSGVHFRFGVFMTLNYFYTELAGFSPFIICDRRAAISLTIS